MYKNIAKKGQKPKIVFVASKNTGIISLKNVGDLRRPFFLKFEKGISSKSENKVSSMFKEVLNKNTSFHVLINFLKEYRFEQKSFISNSLDFEIIVSRNNLSKLIFLLNKYMSQNNNKEAA